MKKIFVLGQALCFLCMLGSLSSAFSQEKNYKNSIGMEFVLIPAGVFMMGCDKDREKCSQANESPRHEVIISRPFYMGKYEVTQAEWMAVMGSNPSKFKGNTRPVENVSWNEIQEFIRKLNQMERTDRYRLPTEAEWEYAARAGSSAVYSFGSDVEQLEKYAWYGEDRNSGSTHPVGQLEPNRWGLYDIHGNVSEWVQDWYDSYSEGTQMDPKGSSSGEYRVLRGGSWYHDVESSRSTYRGTRWPYDRYETYGFRVALSQKK